MNRPAWVDYVPPVGEDTETMLNYLEELMFKKAKHDDILHRENLFDQQLMKGNHCIHKQKNITHKILLQKLDAFGN